MSQKLHLPAPHCAILQFGARVDHAGHPQLTTQGQHNRSLQTFLLKAKGAASTKRSAAADPGWYQSPAPLLLAVFVPGTNCSNRKAASPALQHTMSQGSIFWPSRSCRCGVPPPISNIGTKKQDRSVCSLACFCRKHHVVYVCESVRGEEVTAKQMEKAAMGMDGGKGRLRSPLWMQK